MLEMNTSRLFRIRTLAPVVLLLTLLPTGAQAQKLRRMLERGDSLLSVRYNRANIDTAYIIRPDTKWTLRGRLNVSGSTLAVEGKDGDNAFKSQMESDWKSTLSVGVTYLGVSLNLALNPAKMLGKYKDFELNFCSYGNRWGFEVIYQNAHNFTGWYESDIEPRFDLPSELLSMKTLNVNAYYAFNHRRFSYPAAFSQSYIQRRSAGSFLLGLSGQGQWDQTEGDYASKLNVFNIGIGAGYGYNWVPGKGWLLHISGLPTFIVFSKTSLHVNDDRIPLDYHFPQVIITARAAVVRQFNKWFVGASGVYNYTNIGDSKKLAVMNDKWRTRLFVGFRL